MQSTEAFQVDWQGLIDATSTGDDAARRALATALEAGVRFLVQRRGGVPSAVQGLLDQVTLLVLAGRITSLPELTAETRRLVLEVSTTATAPHPAAPRDWDVGNEDAGQHLTLREREMLRCYYVNREPLGQICVRLSVSPERFEEVKARFRRSLFR